MHTVKIDKPGEHVILTKEEYESLLQELEDARDIAAAEAVKDQEGFPAALVNRLIDENPVVALREYRGLAQGELAKKAGLPQSHLSGIESGSRGLGVKVAQRLAKALDVPVDFIIG